MAIENIKTVVLMMFENRSFDNMLGHLTFEGLQPQADGLTPPLNRDAYANVQGGGMFFPFQRAVDEQLQFDLPHEYNFVATQLSPDPGGPRMVGFVEAYAESTGTEPNMLCDPMCFFGSKQVPITSFLAQTFTTCDRWFCPLPTSTQPNRTVAFCGQSEIYQTKFQDIPNTGDMFAWMHANNIDYRVYSDGLTFFSLYVGLWPTIFTSGRWRPYETLAADLNGPNPPQVIIVEPSFQDGPHIGPDHANDNHPPLAVGWGEDLLRRTYQALSTSPVWDNSLMVVYYDEHGGFYDHVTPPPFDQAVTGNAMPPSTPAAPVPYNTLGPRIPAMLISPWVAPRTVVKDQYDHTSVLQFLAERFTPGRPFSDNVARRAAQGIKSLSTALTATASHLTAPAPPSDPIAFSYARIGDNIATPPDSAMGQAFEGAALKMLAEHPAEAERLYPSLGLWKTAIDQARAHNSSTAVSGT